MAAVFFFFISGLALLCINVTIVTPRALVSSTLAALECRLMLLNIFREPVSWFEHDSHVSVTYRES